MGNGHLNRLTSSESFIAVPLQGNFLSIHRVDRMSRRRLKVSGNVPLRGTRSRAHCPNGAERQASPVVPRGHGAKSRFVPEVEPALHSRCMELEPARVARTRVARSGGQARSCRADTESSCGWFREVKRVRRKSGGCPESSCGSFRKSNPRRGSQGGVRPRAPPPHPP